MKGMNPDNQAPGGDAAYNVAAMDVGASSIRLEIAEVLPDGDIRVMEQLERVVRLGEDTFRRGYISGTVMKAAIGVFRDYMRQMELHQVRSFRAVATSAVREANNRDVFTERALMATGMEIEVIDSSEESRLLLNAVNRLSPDLMDPGSKELILLTESGGGSTLLAFIRGGRVIASQTMNLGTIRLREEEPSALNRSSMTPSFLKNLVRNRIRGFQYLVPVREVERLVILGGEARTLACRLLGEIDPSGLTTIGTRDVRTLIEWIMKRSSEELSSELGISLADAEKLLPSSLITQGLIEATNVDAISISQANLRDGLVLDLAAGLTGADEERASAGVLSSARAVADRYRIDLEHAESVMGCAMGLFDVMRPVHGLGSRPRLLLQVACLLHEAGGFVSERAHHKHSLYLISNSEVFGLSHEETVTVAHVARYHRHSMPKQSHFEYMSLIKDRRILISKLAAILRIADALAANRIPEGGKLSFRKTEETVIVRTEGVTDLSYMQQALSRKTDLFEEVFGQRVILETDDLPPQEERMEKTAVFRLPGRGIMAHEQETMTGKGLKSPKLYINRELSWLEFNQRVLDEGLSGSVPLMERLKFFSIASSNLDEFFMVRVAGLLHQVAAGVTRQDKAGLSPAEQIAAITGRVHRMVEDHQKGLRALLDRLASRGAFLLGRSRWSETQRDSARRIFREQLLPVLTPLDLTGLDPKPLLPGLMLYAGVILAGEEPRILAVPVPRHLERFVDLGGGEVGSTVAPVEDLLIDNLHEIPGIGEVLGGGCFRITRDADVEVQEDDAFDLIDQIEEAVMERRRRAAVRLEVDASCPDALRDWLASWLELDPSHVYSYDVLIDASSLMKISLHPSGHSLRYPKWEPVASLTPEETEDIFMAIRNRDILLQHPYESFSPVVRLLQCAASDPDVLAIEQTLYRTSGDSPVIKALETAAEAGKQVMVLVELKARFDEARNVGWAKRLEDAGCHVIHGIAGLKTHSKVLLVLRREKGRIRRYAHLSTGNYNDSTARLYSDIGLLTSDPDLCTDVSAFFNLLTGLSETCSFRHLVLAPTDLREKLYALMSREVENASRGKEARIAIKVNSLEDLGMCGAIYGASTAGVRVDLNVRGICCLRPGLKKHSATVRVSSIVDRYLEHARIFYFENNGSPVVYLSSADLMERNLDKRMELMFPVLDPEARKLVIEALEVCFADNVKARVLDEEGLWTPLKRQAGETRVRAQETLHREAVDRSRRAGGSAMFRPV